MKNQHFITIIFILFVSCADNGKTPVSASAADSVNKENLKQAPAFTGKHVDWEIGDANTVAKVMEFYQSFDGKNPFVASDYFADTVRLHLPEERGEIAVPNNEISRRLKENWSMYQATPNDILSSVALRDKISGEDWVMITAYSKWTGKDGKRDSALFHDDWRLVNGKIDLLISFHKIPPKGFVNDSSKQ